MGIGGDVRTVVEANVAAYTRVICLPQWHRTCTCTSAPVEVPALLASPLIVNALYRTRVWARLHFERYACFSPPYRMAAVLADHGLPILAETLGDSVARFVLLFEWVG